MKWRDLSVESQVFAGLIGGIFTSVLLLGAVAFAPWVVIPVLTVIGGATIGAVIVTTRRSYDALHGDDAWRRALPPPVLPSMPPRTSPTRRTMVRPVIRDTCPVDGAALAPFTGDDRRCGVCLGVLLSPSSFEVELERFGVEREIVKALAEGHPTTSGCPACARMLAAPRLRDVVPLVCVGCGAAFFHNGDLEIFRGERPPRPRPTRPFDDRTMASSSSAVSASWSDSWRSDGGGGGGDWGGGGSGSDWGGGGDGGGGDGGGGD